MKDGGPAFPMTGTEYNRDREMFEVGSYGGMSLRDYFAIHAPEPDSEAIRTEQSIDRMANPHNDSYKPRLRETLEIKAHLRFKYADAMVKARTTPSERGD